MGKERKCKCGEKETTEHIIECEEVNKGLKEKIKVEWMKETKDIKRIEEVTEWMEGYIEEREKREQRNEEARLKK